MSYTPDLQEPEVQQSCKQISRIPWAVLKIEACPQWSEGACVRVIHPGQRKESARSASGRAHFLRKYFSNILERAGRTGLQRKRDLGASGQLP